VSAGPDRPLALIGARGAGKSTVGRLVAARLGRPFVDLDDAVKAQGQRAGLSAASAGELLARIGAARFRALEATALRLLLEPGARIVLATGGGVVEHADSRAWLHRCAFTLFLSVPVDVLQQRLRSDPTPRPSLTGADPVDEVAAVLARREATYRALADLVVECGAEGAEAVASRVLEACSGSGPVR
jgi:shikimate kinase